MNLASWRHVSASVIGTSHERVGGVCQDSNICTLAASPLNGDVLIAVVADGAGSATQSATGSAMACQLISDAAAQFVAGSRIGDLAQPTVEQWIQDFQKAVEEKASTDGSTSREYACTLLGSIVGPDEAAFFQIGDGSIVVADSEELSHCHVFWPERGEYENMTFFATEPGFAVNLKFQNVYRKVVELAMFSDGLQRLALDFAKTMPYEPFFRGLFPSVRAMTANDGGKLNQSLIDFLNSSRVNERTDDDKTLILATRVQEMGVQ